MIVLDGCCGAGGAARGYTDAGHEVWGVDNASRPLGDYLKSGATRFWQKDILQFLAGPVVPTVDFIHVSPPCQRYSRMTNCRPGVAEEYPDLIGPVRELLIASGKPYVIENVPGSPLREPVTLCGQMFGHRIYRHRWFEPGGGFTFAAPVQPAGIEGTPNRECGWHHPGKVARAGHFDAAAAAAGMYVSAAGHERRGPVNEAMAIDWVTQREDVAEAIPPYFTYWIGKALVEWTGAVEQFGSSPGS